MENKAPKARPEPVKKETEETETTWETKRKLESLTGINDYEVLNMIKDFQSSIKFWETTLECPSCKKTAIKRIRVDSFNHELPLLIHCLNEDDTKRIKEERDLRLRSSNIHPGLNRLPYRLKHHYHIDDGCGKTFAIKVIPKFEMKTFILE